MKEVAEWVSAEHGLTSWRKPNILSPTGPYPDLRRRLDEVIGTLLAREAVRGKVRDTALQVRALIRERDELAAQVLGLLDTIATMNRDARIAVAVPSPGCGAPGVRTREEAT